MDDFAFRLRWICRAYQPQERMNPMKKLLIMLVVLLFTHSACAESAFLPVDTENLKFRQTVTLLKKEEYI